VSSNRLAWFAIVAALSGIPAAPVHAQSSSGQQGAQQGQLPTDTERRLRMMLLQRSMGFGGIFAPTINGMMKGGSPDNGCKRNGYSDYAACQAYKSGNGWAADRLQRHESNGAERDWYNR
jgi:hypothetical protein